MPPKKQSLLDQTEASQPAQPKRKVRKLKPQTTDAVVNRALEDNFRGWPASLTDGKQVDGLTLSASGRTKGDNDRTRPTRWEGRTIVP